MISKSGNATSNREARRDEARRLKKKAASASEAGHLFLFTSL